ncbi:hypothetical protein KARACHI_05280 [Pasteurella multocida subsp. multocida]|nr:hypothetical protein UQU_0205375 [Pasteurella multocida subsp. multocida VTCCBAA264]KLT47953.1 hypothetical protein PVACC_05280 [Pasteurella multocida subsp. multocida]RAQ37220.1 hypothetical protein DPQ28_05775 [Pasteurella multocida]KLT50705.1 hypothetical protein PMTX1_05095 [Pasteurella multocida subsp. multocida]KLT51640.1 hypothetical protein PMMV1_05280 [Pasteurella multocida subsp. multocida]
MTDQTLTKEQILEHALGVNLFLARNGDLVRIDAYDKLENIDYPLAVLNFTNEDNDRYFVTDNGRFIRVRNPQKTSYLSSLLTTSSSYSINHSNQHPHLISTLNSVSKIQRSLKPVTGVRCY